jgi:hypothetical protein
MLCRSKACSCLGSLEPAQRMRDTPRFSGLPYGPTGARQLVTNLVVQATPKHCCSLNMAMGKLAVLTGQCLDQRIGERASLERKIVRGKTAATKASRVCKFTHTQRPISYYPYCIAVYTSAFGSRIHVLELSLAVSWQFHDEA